MTKTGAWAGHVVVQARDSVVVPDGISPEDAETVVVIGAASPRHRPPTSPPASPRPTPP